MKVVIDAMTRADWPEVRRIYLEGVATREATFETDAPDFVSWDADHIESPRLVARAAGARRLLGWTALSPVSKRPVYAGVGEVSIYVSADSRGKGIGRALLEELVKASEEAGFWTLEAGIFPENAASIQLHERCGFRLVGVRDKLGYHYGVWRDVLLFERRAALTTL
ncbi:MAG: N-acetyltransferase family protein [Polyangiaceae bacterium]|nr:N-acetyltransferase family protein [Polyangiaceae bacterium]